MKTIIFGSGSIAEKHIKNCLNLKIKISLYSKSQIRKNYLKKKYKSINFLNNLKSLNKNNYDFGIIANRTCEHFKYLKILSKKNINIYCEKPISNKVENFNFLLKKIKKKEIIFLSGYQLLEDPVLKEIKKRLLNKKINSFNFKVGHNYKYWRKQKSFKNSYYLKDKLGGGVANELIHEINLIGFLFGKIKRIKTYFKINKEKKFTQTAVSILSTQKDVVGTLYQDMFSQKYFRNFQIITKNFNIDYNFGDNYFTLSNNKKTIKIYKKNLSKSNLLKKRLKNIIASINSQSFNSKDLIDSLEDIKIIKKIYENKKNNYNWC
jgi:predicted dehydrogenase